MLLQTQVWAFLLLQEQAAIGWDPRSLWAQMGVPAKMVVILLFLMSAWSIGVMIDRLLAYSAARKQSRAFAWAAMCSRPSSFANRVRSIRRWPSRRAFPVWSD